MRVSEEEIARIVQKILAVWKEKKLAEVTSSDHQTLEFLKATFLKNMQVEDQLNKDAEAMMSKYEKQMTGDMDRRKMFQMIKNQLAKERKIVL